MIIPVRNEALAIGPCIDRILESVDIPYELLIVADRCDDPTLGVVEDYRVRYPQIRPVVNDIGLGPANAIKAGISACRTPVIVVTMADGSDDATQIAPLARLVERGVAVACASRYVRTGQQVGGPFVKRSLSRLAGLSLYWVGRVGTHDATNSFKAYSKEFIDRVGIESEAGFEIGLELVAKAQRARLPVAELPTIWLDRALGVSSFKLWRWIPKYLKWYFHAFGAAQAQPPLAPIRISEDAS